MKLTSIGFANYRSIGPKPFWIDLTKRVNVLIGANNSGKSNVFRALGFIQARRQGQEGLQELDRHKRDGSLEVILYLQADLTADDSSLLPHFKNKQIQVGFTYSNNQGQVVHNPFSGMDYLSFSNIYSTFTLRQFTHQLNAEQLKPYKEEVAKIIFGGLLPGIPAVHIIPDIRKIDNGDQYAFDGRGIISTLASWQIPKLGQEILEAKFRRLNSLLQHLLRSPDVTLEVPPERDVIIVRRNNLRLPLSSYGTGIHELIIMAIAVYTHDNALFCIEEPEIHLHPLLQKEFMRFLIEETGNRYLLATHSHALMMPGNQINVVHLWQEDGVTHSRTVESTHHSLDVLHDLGIDASDLLQARSVIWVEGPSDRIYLNRWLELVAPKLKEGVDYSIMFYGGRLLSHLSLDRDTFPSADDLIPLLRINQHSAIIIDSDRGEISDPISETKERIRAECEQSHVHCWITEGREIENDLPIAAITAAYAQMTGESKPLTVDRYAHLEEALKEAYGPSWQQKWSYDKAKVEMARRIAAHFKLEELSETLKSSLASIVAMVKSAG